MKLIKILKKPVRFVKKEAHLINNHKKYKRLIETHREYKRNITQSNFDLSSLSLTKENRKQARKKWEQRYRWAKWTDLYFLYYEKVTGRFDSAYIPDDLYYTVIDRYFNNWEIGKIMDHKCLYPRYFPGIAHPYAVAYRINGFWLDDSYSMIDRDTVERRIGQENEVVVKRATESMGGKGVYFVGDPDIARQTMELANAISGDIVIQRIIKQHNELSRLNPESVNTIRHISLLTADGAKIYSSILRMGVNGSRVDNASSGGITCGILDNGRLKPVAYSVSGNRFDRHPSSKIAFDSVIVPLFHESKKLVKKLHESFPFFKLVSWDVAIDEFGTAVLIEANLYDGELDFHQLNNGPMFGDDQDKILSEINWDSNSVKL